MTCDDYKKMIYLFIELDEAQKQQLQRHIRDCDSCHQLLQTIQRQHRLVSSAFRSEIPEYHPGLTNKIMEAIDTKPGTISIFDTVFASMQNNFIRCSLAAASLLLVVMFTIQTFSNEQNNIAEVNATENKEAKTVHFDSKLFLENFKQSKKDGQLTGLSMLDCIRECRSGSDEICEQCKSKKSTL
jgi:hypothetical protein